MPRPPLSVDAATAVLRSYRVGDALSSVAIDAIDTLVARVRALEEVCGEAADQLEARAYPRTAEAIRASIHRDGATP